MKWFAMFTQTGSEIVTISKALGRVPDKIITNNTRPESWNPELEKLGVAVMIAPHDRICDYLVSLESRTLITLHGYLRILPEDVVTRHDIINGHPGDIIKYPFLKGKDPQAKAIKAQLDATGIVLHSCTAGVDDGPILSYLPVVIPENTNTEELVTILKELQAQLWVDLLKVRIQV